MIDKYNLSLILSISVFALSLIFVVNTTSLSAVTEGGCEWCNDGTCTTQVGGSGWSGCEDASPGGSVCGIYGEPCCVKCVQEA